MIQMTEAEHKALTHWVDPRVKFLRAALAETKAELKELRRELIESDIKRVRDLDAMSSMSRSRLINHGRDLRERDMQIEVLKAKILLMAPLDIPYHVTGTRPPQDNAKIEGRTYET